MSKEEVMSEEAVTVKKRKRDDSQEELEIDLKAPEPASKKALRKAKKVKPAKADEDEKNTEGKSQNSLADEDVVPNRGKRSEHGIWIGNLSFTTTKKDLLEFMTSDTVHPIAQEQITRINMPSGPMKFGKPQNKGFAYIDLVDSASLEAALELSEKLLTGRRVLIKNANSFEGRPAAREGKKDADEKAPSKRVFIGNLAFDTSVDDLEKHFAVCGPIQHTHMATFEDSGKCKGYAWLEFEQLTAAQAAMRGWVEQGSSSESNKGGNRSKQRIWLHNIDGRKLRMEYAEDKTTRYNKRFGKNATDAKEDGQASRRTDTTRGADNAVEVDPDQPEAAERHKPRKLRDPEAGAKSYKGKKSGYADETVKRLTGAIVQAEGQRVVFD